jgi:S1-C subfamily serine protease
MPERQSVNAVGAGNHLTAIQIETLAQLFVRRLGPGNVRWLMHQVLGPASLGEAGDAIDDITHLAAFAVNAMDREGRVGDAITRLRTEAPRDLYLMAGLDRVLRGEALDDNLQRLINENEPFFNMKSLQATLERVSRRVCAIGVGPSPGALLGSGFLIGPDLVLTNHHVVAGLVTTQGDAIVTRSPEGDVYCYFDYFAAPTPTIDDTRPPTVSVQCTQGWLIHARLEEPLDGKANCPTDPAHMRQRLDYAVLRLSKPIGARPARAGGGSLRGWFALPKQIQAVAADKRLIIVQHPNQAPQQLDFGTYARMDASSTRVWYTVNTAEGSSGGAVVDSDGELFALHNAAVEPPNRRVNQGIRIDLIENDLRQHAPVCLQPSPGDHPLAFWSLTDNIADPQPVLGRVEFRENVAAATTGSGKSVIVVTGPFASGVRFSTNILRRIVSSRPVLEFNAAALQTLTPPNFLSAIVDDLGLTEWAPQPAANSTEDLPRWLRLDLPTWLSTQLATDEARNRAKYPAWVVINTIVAPGERLLWAASLKDLVVALAGAHDAGQRSIDIPQLRWLFLTRSAAIYLTGVDRYEEDLTDQDRSDDADPLRLPAYCHEFAACVEMGLPTVAKATQQSPSAMALVAESYISERAAANSGVIPRKELAALAATMIKRAGGVR